MSTPQARSGPAVARNVGAAAARSPLLCFVDADVVIRRDTLADYLELFTHERDLVAAFGSYDTQPLHSDLLSQYRNLLHHFVHQTGNEAAHTFWAGCGAIRREAFQSLGGFSEEYRRPSIEDIELGYRLRAVGWRIRLAKHIQVTHLKRWTFRGMLRTDIRDRALPWTDLIVRTRNLPNDLNLDTGSRISALSVYAFAASIVLGFWRHRLWLGALAPTATLLVLNRALYRFFLEQRGPWFLARVLPLHWLYFGYSTMAFILGSLRASLRIRLGKAGERHA
jgi:GT2 family glycosyltransferase